MIEEWRDVLGWEGFYMISSHGRVLSLPRTVTSRPGVSRWQPSRMVKTPLNGEGRMTFGLNLGGVRKTALVHQEMLKAFEGPPPPGRSNACHRNDVKTDNRLENLYWGSREDNNRDTVDNGKHQQANKTHCANGHEYTPENTSVGIQANGRPRRSCRACKREGAVKIRQRPEYNEYYREYRRRKRAKGAVAK